MKRIFYWFALNGGLLALTIIAIVGHEPWALNMVRFAVWAMTALMTIAELSKDIRAKAQAKGRSIPKWISVTYDIVLIAILAASGHFWCAGAWLWQMMCESSIYDGKKEGTL